jgi:carbon monoxide dehydrogenase subunit G
MKLNEEFHVDQPVATVWEFFEQPELVARCVPGVESIDVVDADHVSVRATQSIGPLTATFDAKITVLERVPHELIRFSATGKSVRGASGNIRTSNAVHLRAAGGDGTIVVVDGDVILAGALGSVGQKIVAKQAGKVTAEFALNLKRVLSGDGAGVGVSSAEDGPLTFDAGNVRLGGTARGEPLGGGNTRPDQWGRLAAALSAVSCLLSLIGLLRSRRRSR